MVKLDVSSWENIRHLLTKKPIVLSVEIFKKIFILIFLGKIVDVMALFSIEGCFLPNFIFEIVWIVNIFIMSLVSLSVTCNIHFS